MKTSSSDSEASSGPNSAYWAADPSVIRCFVIIILVLSGIALFHFGFDRFEDQSHNLLPSDPGAFLLKKPNKAQGAPPRASDGVARFRLAPKHRVEFPLDAQPTGRFLRLSGRIRTDNLLPGNKTWHQARLLLIAQDSNGRRIDRIPHVACSIEGSTNWTHCNQVFEIPDGAKTLVMRFAHSGVAGTAELEAPSLVPVAVKGWYETVRYSLMVLWLGVALACIVKAGLWQQPLGWLIVLLSIIILTGVAAPERLVSTVIEQGFQGLTATRTWLAAVPRLPHLHTDSASTTTGDDSLRGADDDGTLAGAVEKPKIADPSSKAPIPINTAKKSGHAVLFATLGAVSLLVLVGGNPVSNPRTVMAAIAAITIFAASTEVLQMLTTDRGPSVRDLGIDIAGAYTGLIFTWIVLRLLRLSRTSVEKQSSI